MINWIADNWIKLILSSLGTAFVILLMAFIVFTPIGSIIFFVLYFLFIVVVLFKLIYMALSEVL